MTEQLKRGRSNSARPSTCDGRGVGCLMSPDCSCTKLPKPSGPPPFYNPQLAWMAAFYPNYEGDDGDE